MIGLACSAGICFWRASAEFGVWCSFWFGVGLGLGGVKEVTPTTLVDTFLLASDVHGLAQCSFTPKHACFAGYDWFYF